MTLRFLAHVLILLAAVSVASAQQAGQPVAASPARQEAVGKQFGEHLAFVQRVYRLDAGQVAKLRPVLTGMAPAHQQYEAEYALTLRRVRIARSIVLDRDQLTVEARNAKAAPFERQYWRIVTNAPLSLASIARHAESLLSKEQVAETHGRLKTRFAGRMKDPNAEFDIQQFDALFAGSIPDIELPNMVRAGPSPQLAQSLRPTLERTPDAQAEDSKLPKTRAQPSPRKTRPPSPRPPRNVGPAPVMEEWAQVVEKASSKYGLTQKQKVTASAVLESCQKRAESHRQEQETNYASAQAIADPKEKGEKLGKLNRRLDLLYDELTQRIGSIATMEQKASAGELPPAKKPGVAKPGAVKKTPTPEGKPHGHEGHSHAVPGDSAEKAKAPKEATASKEAVSPKAGESKKKAP